MPPRRAHEFVLLTFCAVEFSQNLGDFKMMWTRRAAIGARSLRFWLAMFGIVVVAAGHKQRRVADENLHLMPHCSNEALLVSGSGGGIGGRLKTRNTSDDIGDGEYGDDDDFDADEREEWWTIQLRMSLNETACFVVKVRSARLLGFRSNPFKNRRHFFLGENKQRSNRVEATLDKIRSYGASIHNRQLVYIRHSARSANMQMRLCRRRDDLHR